MIIAIDHGNKQIKTVHCSPFTSGIVENTTMPYGDNSIEYDGYFYSISNQRIPYHRNKTEDERFFILTLFAIAHEIEIMNLYSQDVMGIQLAVGLPPAHYGSQNKIFTDYFLNRGIIHFKFNKKLFSIYINDVICFPQAYAAAVAMLTPILKYPRVLIVDIGGFTADYLLMRCGTVDLSSCDSLENGVIVLYNHIQSKINSNYDILLEESDIDIIISGKENFYDIDLTETVNREAQIFIDDLLSTLRERMIDLNIGEIIFVGGGSILLKKQLEASSKIKNVKVIDNINANAKGFEFLYSLTRKGV